MLRSQHEVCVEGGGVFLRRLRAAQHIEEVGGVAEVFARGDRLFAVAQAVVSGEDSGHAGSQGDGFVDYGIT